MIILPWLTLFLMKKEEIRRYLPVGIFAAFSSMVVVDIGSTLNLWALRDNVFPLSKVFPYHLGVAPVVTMWLFKFTYGKFLRYIAVDAIYNLVFAFLITPWLAIRGIRENIQVTSLGLFYITTIHGIILYFYQILQEGAPIGQRSYDLQTAAAKPYFDDEENNGKQK